MLILTRNRGESIIIDDNTKLKVLSVYGNTVKLGLEADKSIPIHREEIYRKIQLEKSKQTKIIYKKKVNHEQTILK